MKAVNYVGPHQVKVVDDAEIPKLQHPDDIIVKVTTVSMRQALFVFGTLLTAPRLPSADRTYTCMKEGPQLRLALPLVGKVMNLSRTETECGIRP